MNEAVPIEWTEVRLGDHARVKARLGWKGLKADEYVLDGPIFLAAPNLRGGRIDFDRVDHLPQWRYDESPEIQLEIGDVLLVKDGSTLGVSALVKALPKPTTVNGSIAVIRAGLSLAGDFLFYAINGQRFQKLIFLKRAGLGVPHLFQRDLRDFRLLLPSLAEQKRIADILSRLDETIEQTEALIAKHQQIKMGLMQELFTRGISPDGRLRPTATQAPRLYKNSLLGTIPKAWSLVSLGKVAEIVSGVTLTSHAEPRTGVVVPYLRVANVQDGYFDLTEIKKVKVSIAQLEKLRLKDGDVLMNEGGDFDKLGRGAVWRGVIDPCVHQNHVFRVRPKNEELQSEFLAYWSQSEFGRKYFILNSKQSTNLASINSSQLHRFPVVIPERQEQIAIQERLAASSALIESLGDEVRKLRAIKNGVMLDLLTGGVRVPLP